VSADARALRMEGGDAARSMADRGFLLRPLASGSLLSCTFCPVLGGVDVTGRRPCRTPCPEGSSLLTPGARRLLRCRPQSRASLWTMSSGGRPWDRRLRPPTSVLKRTPEGARVGVAGLALAPSPSAAVGRAFAVLDTRVQLTRPCPPGGAEHVPPPVWALVSSY
jgi:hypothetical protein